MPGLRPRDAFSQERQLAVGSLLSALKGIGAVLEHLGEAALKDPNVEAAVVTIVQQVIAKRSA